MADGQYNETEGCMRVSIDRNKLLNYVDRQLEFFHDGYNSRVTLSDVSLSLDRIEYCFKHINLKYYKEDGVVTFDHLNGDSYSVFLYFLSREIYFRENEVLAAKIYLLNKMMFGLDVFYKVSLPDIFYFSHPVSTVLGGAQYSDYLVVYQGVTVGSDLGKSGNEGKYPILGEGLTLLANSTIIGNCNIGNNVTFGVNSLLRNSLIENNKIIVGQWPNHRSLVNNHQNSDHYFGR